MSDEAKEASPVFEGRIRCGKCNKRLYEVELQTGTVKIKCRVCGYMNTLSVNPSGKQ